MQPSIDQFLPGNSQCLSLLQSRPVGEGPRIVTFPILYKEVTASIVKGAQRGRPQPSLEEAGRTYWRRWSL